jgi:hypothetical protein
VVRCSASGTLLEGDFAPLEVQELDIHVINEKQTRHGYRMKFLHDAECSVVTGYGVHNEDKLVLNHLTILQTQ